MLRVPQHERKITNDINSPPFVLAAPSKDSEKIFQQPTTIGDEFFPDERNQPIRL